MNSAPQWESFSYEFSQGILSGKWAGEGEQLLLCFHGFRQDQHAFDRVWSHLPKGWQTLVVDLPPFGESRLEGQGKEAWTAWTETLLKRFPDKSWHLMGYSMGGKLALMLHQWQLLPVKSLCLIAADGIRSHPIQDWAMYSWLGSGYLGKVCECPVWFDGW